MSLFIRLFGSLLLAPLFFVYFFARTALGDLFGMFSLGFLYAVLYIAAWVFLTVIAVFVTAGFTIMNWFHWIDTGDFQ